MLSALLSHILCKKHFSVVIILISPSLLINSDAMALVFPRCQFPDYCNLNHSLILIVSKLDLVIIKYKIAT